MLPFEPELEEFLKARYEDAVRDIIVTPDTPEEMENHPGQMRKHVFDFYDGLRLVVCKERRGGSVNLHFSASAQVGNVFENLMEYVFFVRDHINTIRPSPLMGIMRVLHTNRGVLHILYDDNQIVPRGNPMWN